MNFWKDFECKKNIFESEKKVFKKKSVRVEKKKNVERDFEFERNILEEKVRKLSRKLS